MLQRRLRIDALRDAITFVSLTAFFLLPQYRPWMFFALVPPILWGALDLRRVGRAGKLRQELLDRLPILLGGLFVVIGVRFVGSIVAITVLAMVSAAVLWILLRIR